MTHCTKCGASIKHIYNWNEEPYGSTCVERVSGINPRNWQWTNDKPDTAKTIKSEEERKQDDVKSKAKWQNEIKNRALNLYFYAELLETLEAVYGDFSSDMHNCIENTSRETLEDCLSER